MENEPGKSVFWNGKHLTSEAVRLLVQDELVGWTAEIMRLHILDCRDCRIRLAAHLRAIRQLNPEV